MEVSSDELTFKPALLASMLDPRHKHLQFLSPAVKCAAKTSLLTVTKSVDVGASGLPTAKGVVDGGTSASQGDMRLKIVMRFLLGDDYNMPTSKERETEGEIESYKREVSPPLTQTHWSGGKSTPCDFPGCQRWRSAT